MKQIFYLFLFSLLILLPLSCSKSDSVTGRWAATELTEEDVTVITSNEQLTQTIRGQLLQSVNDAYENLVIEFTSDGRVLKTIGGASKDEESETRYAISDDVLTMTTQKGGEEKKEVMVFSVDGDRLILQIDCSAEFRASAAIDSVVLRTSFHRQ